METDLQELQKVIDSLPLQSNESIRLNHILAGGVVSLVADAIYIDESGSEHHVAIKYTKDAIPRGSKFAEIDRRGLLTHAAKSHHLNEEIIAELSKRNFPVPKVLKYFPEHRVTIMRNFNADGYELMQTIFVERGALPEGTAERIGKLLSEIQVQMQVIGNHVGRVEKTEVQMQERTIELMISFYNGRMDYYNEMWDDLTDESKSAFIWPDGHPKNMAVNEAGEVMFFDFGRNIDSDPAYILPNFLGQILLFTLTGALTSEYGIQFSLKVMTSFLENMKSYDYDFNEKAFVRYAVAELAHRGKTMRWIDSKLVKVSGETQEIKEERAKAAVDHVIDIAFSKTGPITTVDDLFAIVKKIAQLLQTDEKAYRRPIITAP